MISHHSNLDEDCKYDDVVNEIKRCLEIGISIGEILADSALWEGGLGHFVELTGQQIRDGLSDGFLCRPALRLFSIMTQEATSSRGSD